MFQITRFEKTIAAVASVLLIFFITYHFMNTYKDIIAWVYIVAVAILIFSAEIYIFLSYVSTKSNIRFLYMFLRIDGVAVNERVCLLIDGRPTHRYKGAYNGAIKLRGGTHKIGFLNERFEASTEITAEDGLSILVNVTDSTAEITTDVKKIVGTEEEKERSKRFNRINAFLFFMTNLLMFLAVLRLLALFDVI